MSLIVLASDKGSPGVTTTAVALAGVWPRRAILAECDPAGGDLVYRTPGADGAPLNPNIGMLSLATSARHGLSAHQLEAHLQRMNGGLEVVAGLATGDQSAGLAGLWTALGRAFDALPDADVIADCGRVDAASPALDLMAGAALVVLLARTSAEQLAHLRDRALSLLQRVGGGTATAGAGPGVPIGVVLIVDPKQRARVTAQVDELLRSSGLPVRVIGTIAEDPDGADLINGRGRGRLDRTLLIRSAREVALDLARMYAAGSQEAAMTAATPQPPNMPTPSPIGQPVPGTGYQPLTAPAQPPAQPPTQPVAHQPTQPRQPAQPQRPTAPRHPRPGRPAEPTVWPGQEPAAPANGFPPPDRQPQSGQPQSGHQGFTSVTLGGGPDPQQTGPAPVQPPPGRDPRDPRDPRPSPREIPPGPGDHRAAPNPAAGPAPASREPDHRS